MLPLLLFSTHYLQCPQLWNHSLVIQQNVREWRMRQMVGRAWLSPLNESTEEGAWLCPWRWPPGSQPSLMQALFTQMNRKDTLKFCHWSLSVCLSKTISSSIFMLYSKQIKCSVINEGLYGLNTFKTESPLNLQKKSHNYSFRIFTFLHNFRVYIEFWKSEAY